MIFFDRSVPKGVADAIKSVRDDACWLEDVFEQHWIKDQEWIPEVGARGYLVISRDKKIRTRPEERRAIRDNNVGCFLLNYKQPLNRWEILKLVASTLDEMEEKFANTPRPFMYLIDRNGRFTRYFQLIVLLLHGSSDHPQQDLVLRGLNTRRFPKRTRGGAGSRIK